MLTLTLIAYIIKTRAYGQNKILLIIMDFVQPTHKF
jgi:hypothetical protein